MVTVHSVGGADTFIVLWCQVKVLETLQEQMETAHQNQCQTSSYLTHGILPSALSRLPPVNNADVYLEGVSGVNPGHLEHVSDLFSQADACSAVGCNVNAGNALSPSQLRRFKEQLILLRPKGANHVGDVVRDDNDLPTLWVLWSLHPHPEGNHSHLVKSEYIRCCSTLGQTQLMVSVSSHRQRMN